MTKIKRNELCPCGSGKEYKNCCAKKRINPESIIAIKFDPEKKLLGMYSDDMLINQIRRENLEIAITFDKLYEKQLKQISRVSSQTFVILFDSHSVAVEKNNDLKIACVSMLLNASSTFTASVMLLRSGYRFQFGILLRNILETISTTLHLVMTDRNELEKFEQGKLQSTKTIATAKKALPPFGQLYGILSEEFVHIGSLQREIQPLIHFSNEEKEIEHHIFYLKMTAWLLYITSELICSDVFPNTRYWKHIANNDIGQSAYSYAPSKEELEWAENFLKDNSSGA